MDSWDSLNQKHGVSPKAAEGGSGDPWAQLADRHGVASIKDKQTRQPATPEPVVDFSGNLQIGPLDTGIPLPQFVNKGLAQIGSGMADWALGARQMLASKSPSTLSDLVTGKSDDARLRDEAAGKRKLDSQLNDGIVGKTLNFAGKVAPSLAIPMVGGPVLGGAVAGGVTGAFEPVAGDESRTANTALGAGLGAVVPAAVSGVRRLARPDAATAALADKAAQMGIPVGVADQSKSGLVKGLRSVLDDTPFVGNIGATQKNTQQQAFNQAVGKTFGADAPSLSPDVMSGAKSRIGAELSRLWDNNTLKIDGQYINDLQRIAKRAENLNPEQAAMVQRQVQTLLSKANNAEIPGGFANNWQSELRLSVDGEKGLAKDVLNDLRKSSISAFNRGVSADDAAALTKARGQYANFKTIEPLMTKGELGVAGRTAGDVPAALLSQQVNQQMGNRAVGTPMGDLASIGSRFIANRTPQTGGSARALVQNSIVGGALTGGGYLGAGAGGAIAIPALAGAAEWALGSPTLAKALRSQATQRGLLDAPKLTPALLESMKKAGLLAPVAAGPGLLGLSTLE